MIVGLLLSAIFLIVVCLVARNQTEYRLTQLRSQLLALRSEEKRLAQEHEELEQMISQIGETLARGERRRQSLRDYDQELIDLLQELHQEVRGEELDLTLLEAAPEEEEPPAE